MPSGETRRAGSSETTLMRCRRAQKEEAPSTLRMCTTSLNSIDGGMMHYALPSLFFVYVGTIYYPIE